MSVAKKKSESSAYRISEHRAVEYFQLNYWRPKTQKCYRTSLYQSVTHCLTPHLPQEENFQNLLLYIFFVI